MGKQMREETVLFEQTFAIAHGAVMALDKDTRFNSARIARGDDAGCGEGARAHGEDFEWLAEGGKAMEKIAQFGEGERRPVRWDQRTVHAVSFNH